MHDDFTSASILAVQARNQWPVLVVGLFGSIGAGLLTWTYDTLVRDSLSLTPLYLLPVAYGAWRGTKTTAFLITVANGIALVTASYSFAPVTVRLTMFVSQFTTYTMVAFLIMYLRNANIRERGLARTDALTELTNSLGFTERSQVEIHRMKRTGRPISLIYIDVDDFKKVNDTQGHAAGDRALKVIAAAVRASTRASDVTARIGGDEFAVLMPDTDRDGTGRVVERLRQQIMWLSQGALSCSIGSVTFKDPPTDVDALLHAADLLMYEAKAAKKRDRSEPHGTGALRPI